MDFDKLRTSANDAMMGFSALLDEVPAMEARVAAVAGKMKELESLETRIRAMKDELESTQDALKSAKREYAEFKSRLR